MTLTIEQWKEILDAVNSNGDGILEAIKEESKKKCNGQYSTLQEEGFNVNHPVHIVCMIHNKQYTLGDKNYTLGNKNYTFIHGQYALVTLRLLHIAAIHGHTEVAKALLEQRG